MPIVKKLMRLAGNAQTEVKAINRQLNSTSLSSSATIEIVLDDPKSLYTSGDVLSGEVIIRLAKEIDVSEITLKYKVDEYTELIAPESSGRVSSNPKKAARDQKREARRNRDGRDDRVFKSEKRIFESAVKLFPSQEVAQHLSGKLTLPQGTHKYPFSIRIPTNRPLPPTFTDAENKGTVYHHLKATLRRSSQFKQNARYELPMEFTPSVDSSLLHKQQVESRAFTLMSNSLFNRSASGGNITIKAPAYILLGSQFSLDANVYIEGGANVTIQTGTVELTASREIKSQGHREVKEESELVCNLGRIGTQGSSVDLGRYLQSLTMSQSALPSFSTTYISVAYVLTLSLCIGRGNDRPERVHVSVPVVPVGRVSEHSLAENASPTPIIPARPKGNEKSSYTPSQSSQPPSSSYPPEKPSHTSTPSSQQPWSGYPPEKTSTSTAPASSENTHPVQQLGSNNPFSSQWTGNSKPGGPENQDVPPPDYY